jgi:putative membrane protein
MKLKSDLANLLRGGLIGVAEVIPGVSGGTVALVVGVYERIIRSGSSLVLSLASLIGFRLKESRQHAKAIEWRFLLTLLFGMVLALVGVAALIEPLLEGQPVLTRALFAGLIFASIYVPYKLAGKFSVGDYLIAALAAGVAFGLTSLPRLAEISPAPWQILLGAALAICALVLPGVSGSFLLLTLGLYAPTLAAVNDRNFGYLGLFLLGAIFGLGSFVLLLRYLLERKKHLTMVVMTGLMAGSLRALWPWQDEVGSITTASNIFITGLVFFVGVVLVAGLIAAQARIDSKD